MHKFLIEHRTIVTFGAESHLVNGIEQRAATSAMGVVAGKAFTILHRLMYYLFLAELTMALVTQGRAFYRYMKGLAPARVLLCVLNMTC